MKNVYILSAGLFLSTASFMIAMEQAEIAQQAEQHEEEIITIPSSQELNKLCMHDAFSRYPEGVKEQVKVLVDQIAGKKMPKEEVEKRFLYVFAPYFEASKQDEVISVMCPGILECNIGGFQHALYQAVDVYWREILLMLTGARPTEHYFDVYDRLQMSNIGLNESVEWLFEGDDL